MDLIIMGGAELNFPLIGCQLAGGKMLEGVNRLLARLLTQKCICHLGHRIITSAAAVAVHLIDRILLIGVDQSVGFCGFDAPKRKAMWHTEQRGRKTMAARVCRLPDVVASLFLEGLKKWHPPLRTTLIALAIRANEIEPAIVNKLRIVVLLGDDLVDAKVPCTRQMLDVFEEHQKQG